MSKTAKPRKSSGKVAVQRDDKGRILPGQQSLNADGRPRKEDTLSVMLREYELEPIPTGDVSHVAHWWGNMRAALDLLAETIGAGSFSSLQLSAFTTLLELWTIRAHGKAPQPITGDLNVATGSFAEMAAAMNGRVIPRAGE